MKVRSIAGVTFARCTGSEVNVNEVKMSGC
jgi:hypothetical protein